MSEAYNHECADCRHGHCDGMNEMCIHPAHTGPVIPAPCPDYDPVCSHCGQSIKKEETT